MTAAKVESRNIDKMPYLFHIVKISSNSIDVSYSIIPDTSESMRRAYVVKNLAGIKVTDDHVLKTLRMLSLVSGIIE